MSATHSRFGLFAVKPHAGKTCRRPAPSSFLDRVSLSDRLRASHGQSRGTPPCSRPSRTSPSGGPQVGPSLTAAARDGRSIVRAGMEEWLRRGPNKRMTPSRRIKYHQRYPDPKHSTVHQIGTSPVVSAIGSKPVPRTSFWVSTTGPEAFTVCAKN